MKKLVIYLLIIFLTYGFRFEIIEFINSKYPTLQRDLKVYLSNLWKSKYILLLLTFLTAMIYKYFILLIVINRKVEETEIKITKHLGNKQNIGICGSVGAHKTSTAVFVTQVLEADKINKMYSRVEYIRNKCYFLDFSIINDYIFKYLNINLCMSKSDYNAFTHKMYLKLNLMKYLKKYSNIYSSFRNDKQLELVSEYVELFYYLNFRKVNVISNTAIYSENTGYNSFIVKEDYFKLYKSNEFPIEKYMVIFEDEKGILDNAREGLRRDTASLDKQDNGKSQYYMLIRHTYEGTTTMIGIQQNLEDFMANQRRLYQVALNLDSNDEIILFGFERHLLKLVINYLDKREMKKYNKKIKLINSLKEGKKKNKLIDKYYNYLNRKNQYKVIKAKLYNFIDYLASKDILIERSSYYTSIKDVGKNLYNENKSTRSLAFPLLLFIPKNRTWPYYDTYSYQNLVKKLKTKTSKGIVKNRRFNNTRVNPDEFDYMNYEAFNKINEKIENSVIDKDMELTGW